MREIRRLREQLAKSLQAVDASAALGLLGDAPFSPPTPVQELLLRQVSLSVFSPCFCHPCVFVAQIMCAGLVDQVARKATAEEIMALKAASDGSVPISMTQVIQHFFFNMRRQAPTIAHAVLCRLPWF